MKNITVSVDDQTHRLARIRAAELDTSVSALVREYLRSLAKGPRWGGQVKGAGWRPEPRKPAQAVAGDIQGLRCARRGLAYVGQPVSRRAV